MGHRADPYQRLLACRVLTAEQEARLAKLYAATNPRRLREELYQAVAQLWQHVTPNATPTRTREEAASPQ